MFGSVKYEVFLLLLGLLFLALVRIILEIR